MSGRGRGRGRGRPQSEARLLLQRSAQEAGLDAGNLRNLQDITRPRLFPDYEWHSSGRVMASPLSDDANAAGAAAAAAGSAAKGSKTGLQVPQRDPSTVYLINKSREMTHQFQNSPFYVRPLQEADVVRYSKRPRPLEPNVSVADFLASGGGAKEPASSLSASASDAGRSFLTDPEYRFFPAELLPKSHRGLADRSMKELSTMTPEEYEAAVTATDDSGKPLTLEEMAAKELQRRRQERDAATGDEEDGTGGDLGDDLLPEEDEEEEVADYTTNYYESEGEEDANDDGDAEATF